MRKIGLLLLVLVLAMGALGVAYAHWNGELVINGTVNTGTFGAELTQNNTVIWQPIDDEPFEDGQPNLNLIPCGSIYETLGWIDSLKTQDNAYAECVLSDEKVDDYSGDAMDTITITVTDAYPCYEVWCPIDVHCIGTVPIHVWYTIDDAPAADVVEVMIIKDPVVDQLGDDHFDLTLGKDGINPTTEANPLKLHQCESAHALVYIHPVQPNGPNDPGDDKDGAEAGETYTFDITIHYQQAQ
jgi:hypothetical protein